MILVKRTIALLGLFGMLAALPADTLKNADFSDGIKEWRLAYTDLGTAEVSGDGGVRLTVSQEDKRIIAFQQNITGLTAEKLIFKAEVEAPEKGVAYLQVKLYKDKKSIAVVDSPLNSALQEKLQVTFSPGDVDYVQVNLRIKATATMAGKAVTFRRLALVTPPERRILLAGDSTVASYTAPEPSVGWGQVLSEFCTDQVEVINLATSGRSTKSFIDEQRWDKLLAQVRAGDTVIVQFGHNDQKKDKPVVYAAAETDYTTNLKRFISDIHARQAQIILCTPVQRLMLAADGSVRNSLEKYPEAVRQIGTETGVPVIDLTAFTTELYQKTGTTESLKLFNGKENDRTHFSREGALLVAAEVARQIKAQQLDAAKYLQ